MTSCSFHQQNPAVAPDNGHVTLEGTLVNLKGPGIQGVSLSLLGAMAQGLESGSSAGHLAEDLASTLGIKSSWPFSPV